MCEDEIYVTCICGRLVNEADMAQHIEDCLKDVFIREATSVKISNSNNCKEKASEKWQICGKCIRCGHFMYKEKGKLITFYPLIPDSIVTCCSYRNKSNKKQEMMDSMNNSSKLPNSFHQDTRENGKGIMNCIDNIVNAVDKCLKRQERISTFLESLSEKDESTNSRDTTSHTHYVVRDEMSGRPTCRLFHIALFPNYEKAEEDSSYRRYSLLLQILDTFSQGVPVSTQTDVPATREFGVQVKILGIYPEEVLKLLGTGKTDYDIPEFDPKAEAAYRSHLSTLIPCSHCSRTFSPDRIQKHMSCCIERPRPSIRECITPTRDQMQK